MILLPYSVILSDIDFNLDFEQTEGCSRLLVGNSHVPRQTRFLAMRLSHMGFRCATLSRNMLANANATRPWQIYADYVQHLIGIAICTYVLIAILKKRLKLPNIHQEILQILKYRIAKSFLAKK